MEATVPFFHLRILLAGGLAGVASKTVVAPFERVKIVCQTGASKGMVVSFKNVLQGEGVCGFWRGNTAACIRILPHKGILFGCNDMYKDKVAQLLSLESGKRLPPVYSMIAGSLAGLTASMLTYPLDFIRTRMAGTIGFQSMGIVKTAMCTIHAEGILALFRGMTPTLIGAIPYEGIKFGVYDVVLRTMVRRNQESGVLEINVLQSTMAGGIAGAVATVLTYPNDTVRRRMQMQGQHGKVLYKSTLGCYRNLWRAEGIAGFYQGLLPTIIRAFPNMGIQFAAYEGMRKILGVPRM